MLVKHAAEVPSEIASSGSKNTTVRWLIAESDGAPNFYMRLFEVGPGGTTPHHSHAWEHEIYIFEGTGKLVGNGISQTLEPHDVVFIPGGEIHHMENTGEMPMKILCLIPRHD